MIIEYISNIRTLIAFFNQFTNDPILSEICMLVNLWINSCEQIHWFVHQEHQNCLRRKFNTILFTICDVKYSQPSPTL